MKREIQMNREDAKNAKTIFQQPGDFVELRSVETYQGFRLGGDKNYYTNYNMIFARLLRLC